MISFLNLKGLSNLACCIITILCNKTNMANMLRKQCNLKFNRWRSFKRKFDWITWLFDRFFYKLVDIQKIEICPIIIRQSTLEHLLHIDTSGPETLKTRKMGQDFVYIGLFSQDCIWTVSPGNKSACTVESRPRTTLVSMALGFNHWLTVYQWRNCRKIA